MAKFKVGDRVKLNVFQYPLFRDKTGTITVIWHDRFDNYSYNIDFPNSPYMANNIPEKWLELVEPKEDKPSKVVYDYRGHDNMLDVIRGMLGATVIVDQKDYCDSELRNHARARNIDLVMYVDRRKETLNQDPFKLNPHEFGNKIKLSNAPYVLNEDGTIKFTGFSTEPLEKLDIPLPHELQMNHRVISGLMTKTIPVMKGTLELVEEIMNYGKPKNRIPDRVVFNQDKGKVTVLMSKHLDGVAPYWAYTSKVHGDDKFDAEIGLCLSYYKYLIRALSKDVQHEMIDRIFKLPGRNRFSYLLGVIEQEVLKMDSIKTYKDWQNLYLAILNNHDKSTYMHTWDYLEWKEMLRVHELETKREEQKAIRKEIKKHEQEIEKLKKKGV